MSEPVTTPDWPTPLRGALAEEWLDDKRSAGRGLSDATEACRRDLAMWAFTIAELLRLPRTHAPTRADRPGACEDELARVRLEDLGSDTIRRAAAALARQGYSPASRARMLAALRGFCRWLAAEGHSPRTRRSSRTARGRRRGCRAPSGPRSSTASWRR